MNELDPSAFGAGYNQGAALVSGIRKQRAALDAGSAFAGGDYSGAASALGNSGDIGGALQVQEYGAQQTAAKTAAANQQKQEAVTALLHMATGLKRVSPDQRPHAYQTVIAPLLRQQGVDEAHIQSMAQSPMDDQTLDATITALGGEVQKLQDVGPGHHLVDPATGKVAYAAPEEAKWQAVPEGGMLVNTTGMTSGGGQAAPGGGAAPQPVPVATTGKAAANNNPGNLRWDGKSRWQGMTGVDPQGFVQFDTPDNGVRAAGINLSNQAKLHGLTTLAGIIAKYAPASDRNDTAGYIQSVAQQTGLDPNAQLNLDDPATRNRVLQAMFNVEGGGTPARAPTPPAAAAAAPPAPQFAAGNPNVIMGRPKATTRPATAAEKQAYGIDPSTPAQMKPDGSIDVISGGNAPADHEVYANGATGEDLLKALDPATASQVKAYADGRAQFPTGSALKSPYFQKLLGLVAQYDTSFDLVNYNARAATRKAFTSGQYSQNITSFNTALGHLDNLDKSVDGLNNGGFTWFNAAKNYAYGNNSADAQKELARFEAGKTAVIDELPKVFRGTSGTEADVKHWADQINTSKSPEALHETVRAIAHLIESRISSLSDTYSTGMGKTSDAHDFLTPKANAVLQRLGVTDYAQPAAPAQRPSAPAATPAARPAPQRTEGGATVSNW